MQVIIDLKKSTFHSQQSLKIHSVLANSAYPDAMWHFIWDFAVCHSTHLGTSSPQRVNAWADPFFHFYF